MTQSAAPRRTAIVVSVAVLLSATAAIYLAAGITRAYFVADDFQWLAGGHVFTPARIFNQIAGDHFYRPVVDVWFAGIVSVCGYSVPCYHLTGLSLHLVNVALVLCLALALFADLRSAFLAGLLFAIEPGYTQAVVWLSAATALLMTMGYLGSLLAQALSWRQTGRRRRTAEGVAVLLFACGLFSHEGAITLPIVSWIMWRIFAPEPLIARRGLAGGLIVASALFLIMTVLANYRNPIFTGSHYTAGWHSVRHALDYFVALYVGPGWWGAYAAVAAAIALFVVAGARSRFGALWLLVTVLPYVGFTAGNVSRYLYLPSIGFALALAAAVVGACDWLLRRSPAHATAVRAALLVAGAFVVVRFARFDIPSIRSQVRWTEPWRSFAEELARDAPAPAARVVHVTPPTGDLVDAIYVEPMVQWLDRDFGLSVVIDR